jgi:NADH-quinone oxidoreductase subunit M
MSDVWLLTLLWAVPLAGSLLVLFIPKGSDNTVRNTSLAITLATLVLALLAFRGYLSKSDSAQAPASISLVDRAKANVIQRDAKGPSDTAPGDLIARAEWIPYFNIQYFVGIDGISLSLVLLTGFVSVLACLASWGIDKQVKAYFSLFLLLLASMIGVFIALDMFLFYVFFEVMLLPMYFLIGVWGGDRREYAAIKFLLYTLFGSVFILVAILLLYFWGGPDTSSGLHSFDAVYLSTQTGKFSVGIQQWIFALFFLGFCIKLPAFPFHTWLPDAHVQAPTPISMILAGILLKIGGYGMVRLAWPLAPAGAEALGYPVAALGVVSIIYGALAAMAQTDFKKLVAYSSVSHMGFVTLGMAALTLVGDPKYYEYGVNGAMFMMIAHGITSTGMFFLVGVIYERAHTRDLRQLGGLFNVMPVYGAVTFLIFFGSMGLPGLCGFIAEVFVVLSAFNYNPTLAIISASAVVLTAGYILWTLQRVFLGRNDHYKGLPDLTSRELAISIPLVIFTVLLGVFPWALLDWMSPSVKNMVALVTAGAKADKTASPPIARLDAPANRPAR